MIKSNHLSYKDIFLEYENLKKKISSNLGDVILDCKSKVAQNEKRKKYLGYLIPKIW